jgi:hypothetical protein
MRRLCAALIYFACFPLAAQPLYKCADAAGRITYASERCDKQGLREVGPVRERTTVVPGPPAARVPDAASKAPAGTGEGARNPDAPAKAATIKPVNPLIERLLK